MATASSYLRKVKALIFRATGLHRCFLPKIRSASNRITKKRSGSKYGDGGSSSVMAMPTMRTEVTGWYERVNLCEILFS